MTTDAILLYHFNSCLFDKNNLGLGSERKYSCMAHTVFRFKKVRPKDIIMRDMTIVATGFFSMRTVRPGSILRCHDMAVHAGFRFIGEVGVRPGGPEGKDRHP